MRRIKRIVNTIGVFIVDDDQIQRLLGKFIGFRGDKSDRFAVKAHPFRGQDWLLGILGAATGLAGQVGHHGITGGEIIGGQNTVYAVQRFGGGDVDTR